MCLVVCPLTDDLTRPVRVGLLFKTPPKKIPQACIQDIYSLVLRVVVVSKVPLTWAASEYGQWKVRGCYIESIKHILYYLRKYACMCVYNNVRSERENDNELFSTRL